jgi:hypothetical protein
MPRATYFACFTCRHGTVHPRLFIRIILATKGKSMEVSGIAPIFLTASAFERACEFYRKLLPFVGLKPVSLKRP